MEAIVYTIWHGGYQWCIIITPDDLPSDFQSEDELCDIARIILADHVGGDIDNIPYPVGMWTVEHGNVYQTAHWMDRDDLKWAEQDIKGLVLGIKVLSVVSVVMFIALLVMT